MPEGIQVEKGLWTGRTGQPYPQMGPAHMSTYGCMGGGWSFAAPLNLALIDPLDAPHIQMKGCHVGGDGNLKGLRDTQGESLLCWYAPSAMGAEDSGWTFLGSWGDGLDMVGVGAWQCLLAGCWTIDVGGQTVHPSGACTGLLLQIPSPPSPPSEGLPFLDAELPPATDWPCATSVCPEKEKGEGGLSQRSGLATKQLKNSQKGWAIQSKKKIPDLTTPELHLQPKLVPPISIQEQAQSISYCSWVVALGSSSLDVSSVNETISDEQRGSGYKI